MTKDEHAQLTQALHLAAAFVGKGMAENAYENTAMDARKALNAIIAAQAMLRTIKKENE